MKITLSWLKDHLETTASYQEISERLTKNGLLVESITNLPPRLKGFIVAEILEVHLHPNAERLQVCQVTTGSVTVQIVCGASNVRPGLKTVLATPGTEIPNSEIIIRQSTIRGVESAGMLCSAHELGLADSSEGIIELDNNFIIGHEFTHDASHFDPLFDIEVTPNRGDCLSAKGLARDLAATSIGKLKSVDSKSSSGHFPYPLQVIIEDFKGCPFYKGRFIKGVRNGPSPSWVQKKLASVGLKSISSLVDISNLIAHDLGQPLHIFDSDKLHGSLRVRRAQASEQFKALDEMTYTLTPEMLVIADQNGPCALAGIMGGSETGCSEETTNIFIEAAIFDSIQVALTGRFLNILSEARYRFERNVDPQGVQPALDKAVSLILELCGGQISEEVTVGICPSSSCSVHFIPQNLKSLTGVQLSEDQCENILKDLGFTLTDPQTFKVPSWRFDVKTTADLVEEILRIHGYDSLSASEIPKTPLFSSTSILAEDLFKRNSYPAQWKIQRSLIARGFSEIYSWSFIKEKWAQKFEGTQKELKINNPISLDMAFMRSNLLPGLLQAFQTNTARGRQALALFEIGQYYQKETEHLGIAGLRGFITGPQDWLKSHRPVDIFDIKADILAILQSCDFDASSLPLSTNVPDWYHPGRSGAFKLGQTPLAYFGELHPALLEFFDLKERVVAFEIFAEAIPHIFSEKRPSKDSPYLSLYQAVERDFSFTVSQEIPAEKLVSLIQKIDKTLISSVSIFDVYQGTNIPANQKSLGIRVRLEPQNSTLTETDLTSLSQKIIETIQKNVKAELRS